VTNRDDWTEGGGAYVVQRCGACGARWYFARRFCPRCGAPEPDDVVSAGAGEVEAVTVVHRAPSDDWRPAVPYALALVRLDEGVRVMGHADLTVAVGDRVRATVVEVAGHRVPRFGPEGPR
jgi:uncharacterized OB-fold protein